MSLEKQITTTNEFLQHITDGKQAIAAIALAAVNLATVGGAVTQLHEQSPQTSIACLEQDCGHTALQNLLMTPLMVADKPAAKPASPIDIKLQAAPIPLLSEIPPVKPKKIVPSIPAAALAEQKNLLTDKPIRLEEEGVDVSWPQCQQSNPAVPVPNLPIRKGFAIVGINHGKESNTNSCLASQLAWAKKVGNVALYVNAANPFVHGAEKYGEEVARADIKRLEKAGSDPHLADYEMVWIDVETGNYWRKGSAWSRRQNAEVIAGMVVAFQKAGAKVGIYSIGPMFNKIVGTVKNGTLYGLPEWHPTGYTAKHPQANCKDEPFTHGKVVMIQGVKNGLDSDIACPAKN